MTVTLGIYFKCRKALRKCRLPHTPRRCPIDGDHPAHEYHYAYHTKKRYGGHVTGKYRCTPQNRYDSRDDYEWWEPGCNVV